MVCPRCHGTGLANGEPCRCAFGDALRLKSQLTIADEILDEVNAADALDAATGVGTGVMVRCRAAEHMTRRELRALMTSPRATLDEILTQAQAAGWEYVNGQWFCPTCAAKLAKGERVLTVIKSA